jgi:antitoxin component YwqK of YwqJK toxin-antitoxin module
MSMQTNLRFLLIPMLALGLTACSGKVDCNDSDVKDDALEIIQSHLNSAQWYKDIELALTDTPSIKDIKEVEIDKNGKHAQCRATYLMTYNGKQRPLEFNYNLSSFEDKKGTEVLVGVGDIQSALMGIVMYEPPRKNGEEKLYRQDKTLYMVRHWKNGREEGMQESYAIDGQTVVRQYEAVAGTKVGVEKGWTPDGTLINELTWKDGKATGHMYADNSFTFSTLGQAAGWFIQLKDGQKDGTQKKFSTSRQGVYVERIENYKDGKLEGPTQNFDSDGNVFLHRQFHDGELVRDEATASSLAACVSAREEHELNSWNKSFVANNIDHMRKEWDYDCSKGLIR